MTQWEELPQRKILRYSDVPLICPGCMKTIFVDDVCLPSPRGMCHERCAEIANRQVPEWIKRTALDVLDLVAKRYGLADQRIRWDEIEDIIDKSLRAAELKGE